MNTLGEILSIHRKKKKLSQLDLMNALNEEGFHVTKTVISKWETNIYEPSIPVFIAACKIIGVQDIYEAFTGTNPFQMLSLLNDEGKELAQNYMQLLIDTGNYKKEMTEVIPFTSRSIRLYATAASAGTGEFLNDDNYELIEVGDEVPADADFGVRINGDSMEPRFVHGQIVWVRQQDLLSDGDIGIFSYDNQAYCKVLRKDDDGIALVSLNQKYVPIAVKEHDSLTIFGKIVG